jgi:hypothetical protein
MFVEIHLKTPVPRIKGNQTKSYFVALSATLMYGFSISTMKSNSEGGRMQGEIDKRKNTPTISL